MKKIQNSDNGQHDQNAEENHRPYVGDNEIDPSETVLAPSFEKLEEHRNEEGLSVAKVYGGNKSFEQLHSRVANGKAKPNPILLGNLMKGVSQSWMNAVPAPTTMQYVDSGWGGFHSASYLPHPFMVEPAGIETLLTQPGRIADVEAPDIPESKNAQDGLIAFFEEVENRKGKDFDARIKTSQQLKEMIAIRAMVSSTFTGRSELEPIRGTTKIEDEERFILLAYPVFTCGLRQVGNDDWYVGWDQSLYLMPVFAHTMLPPVKKFFLRLEEEVSIENAWASMPNHSTLYSDLKMSPFEQFVL